jgi:phosphate/sulfate permease
MAHMGQRLAWALPLAGCFNFAGAVFAPRECTTYIAESTIPGK